MCIAFLSNSENSKKYWRQNCDERFNSFLQGIIHIDGQPSAHFKFIKKTRNLVNRKKYIIRGHNPFVILSMLINNTPRDAVWHFNYSIRMTKSIKRRRDSNWITIFKWHSNKVFWKKAKTVAHFPLWKKSINQHHELFCSI